MLAFIIALLIVVIIGSIVYGIYKLIVGIIKLCRKSSTDQSKRTYNKQSTTKNTNSDYYQQRGRSRRFYENTYDDEDFEDTFAEDLFEDTLDADIIGNYDSNTFTQPENIFFNWVRQQHPNSQIDKDKLVRARLERFNLSEDEAELIFGNNWRNKLGQDHHLLFYSVEGLKSKLMETGFEQMFMDNPEPLFRDKVSHIIDKVIQMIDTVYNENPEYAKSFETYAEESNPGAARTAKKAWEFFKKHKKTDGFDPSENILDTSEAYKIFDLAVSATVEQVKKKYRELVLKWHPDRYKGDKTVAEKMMMKINQAYETIMAAA